MQSPKSDQSDVDDVFSPQKDVLDVDQVPTFRSVSSDCDYSSPGNAINYAYIQSPSQTHRDQSFASASSKSRSYKSAGSTPYRVLKKSDIETCKSSSDDIDGFKTPANNASIQFISGTADNKLHASSATAKSLHSSYSVNYIDTSDCCRSNSQETLTFL